MKDCLELPIQAFFSFYREACKMDVNRYKEHLYISRTPAQSLDYLKFMENRYNKMIHIDKPEKPTEAPPDYRLKAEGREAKVIVMSLFATLKRGLGYGR